MNMKAFGAIVILGMVVQTASADITPVNENAVLEVVAASASGAAVFQVGFDDGIYDPNSGTFFWNLTQPAPLSSVETGTILATIEFATLSVSTENFGNVNLAASLRAADEQVRLDIRSPLLSYYRIPSFGANGRASATVSLSDLNDDGATLTPRSTDGNGERNLGVYSAWLNGYDEYATIWVSLVGEINVGPGGSATVSQKFPSSGFAPIEFDVWDLAGEIAFEVTPGDSVNVTTFTGMLVPQPCPGDVNNDRQINSADLNLLLSAFSTAIDDPAYKPEADVDGDRAISGADLNLMLSNWQLNCDPAN